MASLSSNVTLLTSEYRPCIVGGKGALFHRWNQFCNVVGESALRGGAPAGQISFTTGIVEFTDGTVKEVRPSEIKFCDNKIVPSNKN